MYTVNEVAAFFVDKEHNMSHKKLQKLLYYAYGWSLAILNKDSAHLDNKLFDAKFEAWVHGPVIAPLYQEYKRNGWNMDFLRNSNTKFFDSQASAILNKIWKVYGKYTADDLEEFSHEGTPWINARRGLKCDEPSNNKISDVNVFTYFNSVA